MNTVADACGIYEDVGINMEIMIDTHTMCDVCCYSDVQLENCGQMQIHNLLYRRPTHLKGRKLGDPVLLGLRRRNERRTHLNDPPPQNSDRLYPHCYLYVRSKKILTLTRKIRLKNGERLRKI